MGTRTGTYYTGTIDGTAGSLISVLDTILVTGEGWTKLYSGTDKAVYQQAAGNGFVLRVVDDGSTSTGLTREATVRGAESASDVDTLIDAFPSTALAADSVHVWRKSDTNNATTRNYWAVADGSFFILVINFGTTAHDCYFFGDIEPIWSGDNYATVINSRLTQNSSVSGLATASTAGAFDTNTGSTLWFARTASGGTKIDRAAFYTLVSGRVGNAASANIADYPHPETALLHYRPLAIRTNGSTGTSPLDGAFTRGTLPFFMEMMHGAGVSSFDAYDTYTDTAYDPSSQFIIIPENSTTVLTNTADDRYILQTAGTWNPGY